MKLYLTIALSLLLAGCGGEKVLTADRAKSLAQKRIDQTNEGNVSANIAQLVSNLSVRTMAQPQQLPAGMQRLLGQGYIEQKTFKIEYPDLTGSYTGKWCQAQEFSNSVYLMTLHLSMDQSRPPQISGTYSSVGKSKPDDGQSTDCGNGVVSGVASRQQPYTLRVEPRKTAQCNFGIPAAMIISLQTVGGGDQIVGACRDSGNNNWPLALSGSSAHHNIEQDEYSYEWASKFPSALLADSMLKMGHVVIETCEDLLLATDTTATATLKWHIDLDPPQSAVMGRTRLEGRTPVSFGKQPDGTWVPTSVGSIQIEYNL